MKLAIVASWWLLTCCSSHRTFENTTNSLRSNDTGAICGQVLMESRPVLEFAIGLISERSHSTQHSSVAHVSLLRPPAVIRSASGRFCVEARSGTYDLIVSGIGFPRKVVTGVQVPPTGTTEPLLISVNRGARVRGTVRDDRGEPVAGAILRIEQTYDGYRGDTFWDLANANYQTTSDENGEFEIVGYGSASRWTQSIVATFPYNASYLIDGSLSSHKIGVLEVDQTLEIEMFPVGGISGRVPAASIDRRGVTMIIARSVANRAAGIIGVRVSDDGTFAIDSIPEGVYFLELWRNGDAVMRRPLQRVVVNGGGQTIVTM